MDRDFVSIVPTPESVTSIVFLTHQFPERLSSAGGERLSHDWGGWRGHVAPAKLHFYPALTAVVL